MAGGSWDPLVDEVRAGIYINFITRAGVVITSGERGIVAMPITSYPVALTPKTVYEITSAAEARTLLGDDSGPVELAFRGATAYGTRRPLPGANKVLVYTMPEFSADTSVADYDAMRATLDVYKFDMFVFAEEVTSSEQDKTRAWCIDNRENEGKHFLVVYGSSNATDQDVTLTKAVLTRLADEYSIVAVSGGYLDNVLYSSAQAAPWFAGLIAGAPLNRAITYAQSPFVEVNKRHKDSVIVDLLSSGALLLVNDSKRVKIERGITSNKAKIRKVKVKLAVATDLKETAEENYIGELDNVIDGQKALLAGIKAYLEVMRDNNIITGDITVELDPERESVGDKVYVFIKFIEADSMEEIYFTIETSAVN